MKQYAETTDRDRADTNAILWGRHRIIATMGDRGHQYEAIYSFGCENNYDIVETTIKGGFGFLVVEEGALKKNLRKRFNRILSVDWTVDEHGYYEFAE